MRLERIPGGQPHLALGALLGAVGLVAAALAGFWLRLGGPRPGCLFRSATGWPCATCGSSRLVSAVLSGDIATAFALNPLVFSTLLAVAIWAVVSFLRWVAGLRPRRIVLSRGERFGVRAAILLAVAANWIYLILRGM